MDLPRFNLYDIPDVRYMPGGGTRYLETELRPYRGFIIDARLVSRSGVESKPDGWSFLRDKSFIVDSRGTLLASVDNWRIKESANWPIPFRVGDRVIARIAPNDMSTYDVLLFPRTDICVDLATYVWRPFIRMDVGDRAWTHQKNDRGVIKKCRVTMEDANAGKIEKISVNSPDGVVLTLTSRNGWKFKALKRLIDAEATVLFGPSDHSQGYRVGILSSALR